MLREQHSLENGEEPIPRRRSRSRSRSPRLPPPPTPPPDRLLRRSRWDHVGEGYGFQMPAWRHSRWGPRPAGNWPSHGGWAQGVQGQLMGPRPWSVMGMQVQNPQPFPQPHLTPAMMSQGQGRPAMPTPPPPGDIRPPAWSPPMMPVPLPMPLFQARPVVRPSIPTGSTPIPPPPPPLRRPVVPRSRSPHTTGGPNDPPPW